MPSIDTNKSKRDYVIAALQNDKIPFKIVRDDNVAIFDIAGTKQSFTIIADKHAPKYEVVADQFGDIKHNYETGIVSKITNHIKKFR